MLRHELVSDEREKLVEAGRERQALEEFAGALEGAGGEALLAHLGAEALHLLRDDRAKASGVDESLLEEIGRLLTWPATQAQIEKAMALVPDDVVQLITASGAPDECRAKVQEYVDAGCTCPVLYPLGDDVPAMIEAFAAARV